MPSRPVRVVTQGPSEPVRVVTQGIADPVRIISGTPSDPVRVVTSGISTPVRIVAGSIPISAPILPEVASATCILDLRGDTGIVVSTDSFAGSGTISQSGNTVTGINTLFWAEVFVGDRLSGTGVDGIVAEIVSDTEITLDSSASAGSTNYTITPQPGTSRINQWLDQSGNGHDFSQSGTARPSLQTVSGHSLKWTDQTNDWMLGSDFADNLPQFAIFFVADVPSYDPLITKIGNDGCSDPGSRGWSCYSTSFYLYSDTSNWIQQWVNSQADWHIYSFDVVSVSEIHGYIDGVLSDGAANGGVVGGSGVTSFGNSEPVRIGIEGAFGACDLFRSLPDALLIYQINDYIAWNSIDRAAIVVWLAAKHGIAL